MNAKTYSAIVTIPGVNRWTLTREQMGGSGWKVTVLDAVGTPVFRQVFDTAGEAIEAMVDKASQLVREAA